MRLTLASEGIADKMSTAQYKRNIEGLVRGVLLGAAITSASIATTSVAIDNSKAAAVGR